MHLQMHKRHQIGNIIVSCAADIDVDGDSYELPQHKQDASQEIVATIDLGTLWLGRGELNNQGCGKIMFTEMSEAHDNHIWTYMPIQTPPHNLPTLAPLQTWIWKEKKIC